MRHGTVLCRMKSSYIFAASSLSDITETAVCVFFSAGQKTGLLLTAVLSVRLSVTLVIHVETVQDVETHITLHNRAVFLVS